MRRNQRGHIGLIVLLIVLVIVAVLVVKNFQSVGTQSSSPATPVQAEKVIESFKQDAKKIEELQKIEEPSQDP